MCLSKQAPTSRRGRAHAFATALAVLADDPITRQGAQDEARRELAKSIYQRERPGLQRRAVERVWDWLQDVWHTLKDVTPGGGLGVLALVAVVVAVVMALIWRFGPPRRGAVPMGELLPAGDRERSAEDLRHEATAHASRAEWALAQRAALRALVRDLEERDVLRPRPGWTADEVSTAAAYLIGPAAPRLREATRGFDEVWFGGREATAQTYAQVRDLGTELRQMHLAPPATVPG
ncbi:MAG: DUF4129 domain-containing protein [Frankiaceae bacterium]